MWVATADTFGSVIRAQVQLVKALQWLDAAFSFLPRMLLAAYWADLKTGTLVLTKKHFCVMERFRGRLAGSKWEQIFPRVK
ncbi:hypothetical protein NG798_20315 [Ancylothrix sp. C2]|nr:hypothetical protein [Ancylothrix sp. D3o]